MASAFRGATLRSIQGGAALSATEAELLAGEETSIRSFSPANITTMIVDKEGWSDFILNSSYVEELNAEGFRLFKYRKGGENFYRRVSANPYLDIIYSDAALTTEVVRR